MPNLTDLANMSRDELLALREQLTAARDEAVAGAVVEEAAINVGRDDHA